MTRFVATLIISVILLFIVNAAFLWLDPQRTQDYWRGFVAAVVILSTWQVSIDTKPI